MALVLMWFYWRLVDFSLMRVLEECLNRVIKLHSTWPLYISSKNPLLCRLGVLRCSVYNCCIFVLGAEIK